jgi:LmbE family N-acetylglucosaminyl deacetylase
LLFDRARYERLATDIRRFRPDILITHWYKDRTNWDHRVTADFTMRCVQLAGAAGGILESDLAPWSLRARAQVGFMSSFISSSTVKFLFLASSLTFNAVSFRIVREYQPFSGIDILLLVVHYRLTGQ